jgi:hypothetical protein
VIADLAGRDKCLNLHVKKVFWSFVDSMMHTALSYETWHAGMADLRDDVGQLSYCCIRAMVTYTIRRTALQSSVHYATDMMQ